jgi:hypothetical protein
MLTLQYFKLFYNDNVSYLWYPVHAAWNMYVKDDKTLEGTAVYLVHGEPTMIPLELVYSKAL